jgi:hypothetical protein
LHGERVVPIAQSQLTYIKCDLVVPLGGWGIGRQAEPPPQHIRHRQQEEDDTADDREDHQLHVNRIFVIACLRLRDFNAGATTFALALSGKAQRWRDGANTQCGGE